MELHQRPLGVPPQDLLQQLRRLQIARQAQHLQHGGAVHGAAHGGALVQQAEGVPQGAVRQAAQQLRPVRRQVDPLLPRHVGQPGRDVRRGDPFEGIPLAAGENRGRHLVELRGGQNEHQVLRRLLQDLQQGIKRRCGEHVDLVHDIDPLPHMGGGVDGLVPQGPDLIHAVVGRRVQLQHVQERPVLNAQAGGALTAGVPVHRMLAVDGLGQDLGAGSLAGAPGPCEEVGVGGPPLGHLPPQGLGDVVLADHVGKHLGPPLAVQRLIHGASSLRIE